MHWRTYRGYKHPDKTIHKPSVSQRSLGLVGFQKQYLKENAPWTHFFSLQFLPQWY